MTVTCTGGSDGPMSVDLLTADGTAHSGGLNAGGQDDYAPAPHTFAWADGEDGSRTFDIQVPDDPLNEGTETFALSLVNPVGQAHLGLIAATGIIGPTDPLGPGSYFDQDGDRYTVKLTGGVGQLALYQTDVDGDGRGSIELLELTGTMPNPQIPKAAVSITVTKAAGNTGPEAGIVQLGGVTGSGLKSFTARQTRLTAPASTCRAISILSRSATYDGVSLRALGRRRKDTVLRRVIGDDTTIVFGAISRLTATRIGTGTVSAPAIGAMAVKAAESELSATSRPTWS